MPIPLRSDFDAQMLWTAARRSKDGPQARRLLVLAAIYEGRTRAEAAKFGGVTPQVVRAWVLKLNAHGPGGLIDRRALGKAPRLNDTHRAALAEIVADLGVLPWRLVDLCEWMREEFRVVVSPQTLSRELCAMGYRKLAAHRRDHAEAARAIEESSRSRLAMTSMASPQS